MLKTCNEAQLARGRYLSIAGMGASQVEQVVDRCLEGSGFRVRIRRTSPERSLVTGVQRAAWYRVLLFALPQRIVFEIKNEPNADAVQVAYDERYAPWYLAVLVAVAAIMTPYWVDTLSTLLRMALAPTQFHGFHAAQFWGVGLAGVVFARLLVGSSARATFVLLEEIRLRVRHAGAKVDQPKSGTLTTTGLVKMLFLIHLTTVVVLGVYAALGPANLVFLGSRRDALIAAGVVGTVVVFVVSLARGTSHTVNSIGGEERLAMVGTGVTVQFGVISLLVAQLGFILLGQTTDEFWAALFRAGARLAMDAEQVRAAGLDCLPCGCLETEFDKTRALGHVLLMASSAPGCLGLAMILWSIRLAPVMRRMCERVHEDIELDYGRAAASVDGLHQRSQRAFLVVWGFSATVIVIGLLSLLRLGARSLDDVLGGHTPVTEIGAVDATGNAINFLAGLGAQSYVGLRTSRVFFASWAITLSLPVALSVLTGYLSSRRLRSLLCASSNSLPSQALGLKHELAAMASSAGLKVALAVSPGQKARAVAHRVGLLRPRSFVEVSSRCLEILDVAEQRALVAHELGHHLRGHCRRHNVMQWLGRLTYVGGTFVVSMEDSFGFELQADRAAIETFGVDQRTLRSCLLKMRADAVVQRLGEMNGGLSAVGQADSLGRLDSTVSMGIPSWRTALRDWLALLRADAEMAYWHPSVADRIRALAGDRGKESSA